MRDLIEELKASEPVLRVQTYALSAAPAGHVPSESFQVGEAGFRLSFSSPGKVVVIFDFTHCAGVSHADVVPVRFVGVDPDVVFAPIVERGTFHEAELEVIVPPSGWELQVVEGWSPPEGLLDQEPALVEASVRLNNTAGLSAWHDVAARLPERHEVRLGIERALAA